MWPLDYLSESHTTSLYDTGSFKWDLSKMTSNGGLSFFIALSHLVVFLDVELSGCHWQPTNMNRRTIDHLTDIDVHQYVRA